MTIRPDSALCSISGVFEPTAVILPQRRTIAASVGKIPRRRSQSTHDDEQGIRAPGCRISYSAGQSAERIMKKLIQCCSQPDFLLWLDSSARSSATHSRTDRLMTG